MSDYLNYCRQRGCGEDQGPYEEPIWKEKPEECEKRDRPDKHPEKCDWEWKPKPEKPKYPVTIVSCGNGSGLTLPVNGPSVAVVQSVNGYSPTLVVGTVSLDARGLKDPTIKLDFSSLINYRIASTTGDYSLRIIFQLSRSCGHGARIPLSTFIYENSLSITGSSGSPSPIFEIKDPFSFTWCECNDCGGCCTYLIEIVDISSYNIECASITNVGINAVASGLPEDHR